MSSLLELRAPALPLVRIGLIGLGQRGLRMLERYRLIGGAQIVAVADSCSDAVFEAQEVLSNSKRPVALGLQGEDCWQEMCALSEVDLIYICTPWEHHTPMAVAAMRAGKHVAVEVPAAMSVEDCWLLVETARQTQRHLFLAENCCYDRFHLGVRSAVQRGEFGAITHCEGAYIHDLRSDFGLFPFTRSESRSWMAAAYAQHIGNSYPTHAIGPIAQLLNIHRGDRLLSLTSMSSQAIDEATGEGRVNSTLIRTELGRTILLQLDMTTGRPYSRLQTVCGTKGFAQKYPVPTFSSTQTEAILTAEAAELATDAAAATCPAFAVWQEGERRGTDNAMNYAMDVRLIHCLQNGLPLDIDAYDAAEWSCLTELTALSAAQHGKSVAIPDFTEGNWNVLSRHRFF